MHIEIFGSRLEDFRHLLMLAKGQPNEAVIADYVLNRIIHNQLTDEEIDSINDAINRVMYPPKLMY